MASEQLAVLFADVCDSTAIYESIGDAQALSLINRLIGVLQKKVKANGGTVVKTLGDGMVCRFAAADRAFQAACDMQTAAVAAEAGAEPKLAIKVAFTWGPVMTEGGDVFGDTVNVCSRLVSRAGPRQVLTTQETVDALSESLRKRSRELYPLNVRGRVSEVRVCDILWRVDPDITEAMELSELNAAPAAEYVLKLSYGGDTVVVEPSGSLTVGRDKSNDLVIQSTLASRVHARISGRGGYFVIADLSSNGTFVLVDGHARELALHREEATLGERGLIGLGGPASSAGDHLLRYRLERRKP
jgi:adenylate cyclase